jgi:CO/xanthine dehydrogenase Mo-binding subunit
MPGKTRGVRRKAQGDDEVAAFQHGFPVRPVVRQTVALRLDGGRIDEARIALGGVALKPWRARAAEAVLAGAELSERRFREAADAALAEALPCERLADARPVPGLLVGDVRHGARLPRRGLLHAVVAVSRIARGRVAHLDVAAAKAHPGVVEVMTGANAPRLAQDPDAKDNPFMFRLDLLQNDRVRYAHQPIAVVIAEVPARPRHRRATRSPCRRHRRPRAPADRLIVDTPSQGLAMAKMRLAGLFGLNPKNILVRSPFLGGGFGSKGFLSGPQVLGVMAAKLVGRPVKLVLRREQMFGPVGHRAEA